MIKKNKFILILVSIFFLNLLFFNSVFADIIDSPGNPSGGIDTSCTSNYTYAYQLLCSQTGSAGGGASWHVYQVSQLKSQAVAPYANPYWVYNQILGYGSIDRDNIISTCKAYDYAFVFGWDGVAQPNAIIINGSFQSAAGMHIGPAANGQGIIADATYNTYNQVSSLDTLTTKLNANQNDIKISSALAKDVYIKEKKASGSTVTGIPSSVGFFCVKSSTLGLALTVKAVDTNGSSLSNLMADKTVSGKSGDTLSVSVPQNLSSGTYTLKYWGQNTSNLKWKDADDCLSGNCKYSEKITASVTRYAVYEKLTPGFEGRATALSESVDTGWQSKEDVKKTGNITCNQAAGCSVSFDLEMRSSTTDKATKAWYGIEKNGVRLKSDQANEISLTYNDKILPDETICYSIVFHSKGQTGNDDKRTETACVKATKDPVPPPTTSPSCRSASSSEIVKMSVKISGGWADEVYAKPGDTVTFCGDYNPSQPQSFYDRRIDYAGSGSPSKNCPSIYRFQQSLSGWSNTFSVHFATGTRSNASFGGTLIRNYSYSNGNTSNHYETNTKTVGIENTSQTFDERASVNITTTTPTYAGIATHTCYTTHTDASNVDSKSSCSCTIGEYDSEQRRTVPETCTGTRTVTKNGKKVEEEYEYDCSYTVCSYATCRDYHDSAYTSTSQKTSVAHARVPYNFTNTTKTTTDSSTIFYAGESRNITFDIITSPIYNGTTNGTYATQVHDARWKITVSYPGGSSSIEKYIGTLNSYSTSGSTIGMNTDIVVPDIKAGSQVCVSSSVYPSGSGSSTNWTNPSGNGTWSTPHTVCYIVAKRPSIQILGGNFYTNRNIFTQNAIKYHLAGYNAYYADPTKYSEAHVFGSWADQAIVANGVISGMGSGASLGYPLGSTESTPVSSNTIFCKYTPLTLANSPCSGSSTVSFKGTNNNQSLLDTGTILSKYIYNLNTIHDDTISSFNTDTNVTDNSIYRGKGVYYYHNGSHDLTLSGSTINVPESTTQVVHGNNIYIRSDLIYRNTSGYTNFNIMPKLIIYANNDVYISCNVSRIDAIIVGKKVITCNEGDGKTITSPTQIINITNSNNFNKLTVNGTIITARLIANRVYGAATGANSIESAEVINFDPSLYRLEINSGNQNTDGANANTELTTTYTKELAPRL